MRVPLVATTVVGDEPVRITDALRTALRRASVVLVVGGLGPTADDVTRESIAEVLGLPLAEDEAARRMVEEALARTGRTPTERQYRQAHLPAGADPFPNPVGIAPGFAARRGKAVVVALPGPPAEMKAVFETSVAPRLVSEAGLRPHRRLRVVGMPESEVDATLAPLLAPLVNLRWGLYTGGGEVEVVLWAEEPEVVEAAEEAARGALGEYVYGAGEATLPEIVGRLLAEEGMTLALAESCTGGMVGARITDVPGSSRYFRGSIAAYADAVKEAVLGIPRATLEAEGVVSETVAAAMAEGARGRLAADVGVGITGIAGPGGATEGKPVGLVCIALASPHGTVAETFRFGGDRATIRARAATAALNMIRRYVLQVRGAG